MFLRPIQEIIARYGEFITEWEFQTDTNYCFMHFNQQCRAIATILQISAEKMTSTGVRGLTPFQKPTLLQGITFIPNRVTEFCWVIPICQWGFIFQDPSPEIMPFILMLNQCIVWHWHNQYFASIGSRSFDSVLERQNNEQLGLSPLLGIS
jgi:hypothetical protein